MKMLIANIIVLIFEVLYYSMFMYYAKREGKFSRYVLLFSLITIFFVFVGTNSLISYLILVLMILYGLKYIVKIKNTLYDMLIIIIMLFLKIIIEGTLFLFDILLIKNYFIFMIFVIIIKPIIIFLIKNKLNYYYKSLKVKWNSNNFYIRYIFDCFCFIYIIVTILLKLLYR